MDPILTSGNRGRSSPPSVTRSTSDWLTSVLAPILNRSQQGAAARQLPCAAEGDVVPLTYGSDRVGARILNVIPSGQYVVVQCLWGYACDSINDVRYADKDIPTGTTSAHHADGASDSTWNSYYSAATGSSYTDDLSLYAWSWFSLPVNATTAGFAFSARIKGRKLFDPRKATAYGGSGSHVLGTPSTWEWSDNPSLADADFLYSSAYGCGKTVDWYSVKTAADANDALVSGTEKRRIYGNTFLDSVPVADIAETLRAHAGVFHSFTSSGIKLVVDGVRTTDATYSHVNGEIAELVNVEKKDTGDVPTVVEVVYTDTSAIPYRDAVAEAKASGVDTTLPRRTSQVRMPGVQRYTQAGREALERLNKLRTSDLLITIDVFDKGIAHEPGDVIEVTYPALSISSKKLRLVDHPEYQGKNIWRLYGAEYDPAAYSDYLTSGPTYPDTNLGMPNENRQGLNLLRNADWTEDVGFSQTYRQDSKAIPGWAFAYNTNGTVLRNYDNGHRYNFGRGGICHYIPNYLTSEYCYVAQEIPWDGTNYPDDQYEVSVYVGYVRANIILYGRVLDGPKTTVIQDFTDQVTTGTSPTIGDWNAGYVEGNYQRLWVKVDISANANKNNARWLQILILTQANQTTGAGLYPFAAFHRPMICRAPANVTRATATPWQDGLPSKADGGIVTQGTITDVLGTKPSDSSTSYTVGSQYWSVDHDIATLTSYTNNTAETVEVQVGYQMEGYSDFGGSGVQTVAMRVKTNLNGAGYVVSAAQFIDAANAYQKLGGVVVISVPSGHTLYAKLSMYAERLASGYSGATLYFYWQRVALNLQGIRK